MVNKIFKKVTASLLSLLMVLGMVTVMPVEAATLDIDFDANYALITDDEQSVTVKETTWGTPVYANGKCTKTEDSYKVERNAVITFEKVDKADLAQNEVAVRMVYNDGTNKNYYRSENVGSADYVFADSRGLDDAHIFIVEKLNDDKGILKDNFGRYISLGGDKSLLRTDDGSQAEVFTFVKNPQIIDSTLAIKNVATGKYISFAGDVKNGDKVKVNATEITDDEKFKTKNITKTDAMVSDAWALQFAKSPNLCIQTAKWADSQEGFNDNTNVAVLDDANPGGWQAVTIVPAGNGQVILRDSANGHLLSVDDNDILIPLQETDITKATDKEKFAIIASDDLEIADVTDLSADDGSRTQTTIDLSWTNPVSLYSDVILYQKASNEEEYKKVADLTSESSYKVENLGVGVKYSFKLVYVRGDGSLTGSNYPTVESNVVEVRTRAGKKPATPSNVTFEAQDGGAKLTWEACENATHYQIMRADSMYGTYEAVDTVKTTSATVEYTNKDKYSNYYRIVALNNGDAGDSDFDGAERSEESEYVSLETEMFGRNTIIFAQSDDVAKVDKRLNDLFDQQHDFNSDAQFQADQYQVYFKPGSYEETSCIYLGFYTSLNGLGKLPTDVKLNNIAIPAYLPAGELGGDGNNATCNFWRSAENLSVIKTGNTQGNAAGSWRPDSFNWAVAQAAPMRRVYSTRPVAYDWNYGWASGGYVADCKFEGTFEDKGDLLSAGTFSGQQFYTRNSELTGNAYGCTLNNFFQGVKAPNLPNGSTGQELLNKNGYSNWGVPGEANLEKEHRSEQQIFTNIEETKKLSEKPFLYIDDNGEYQVFVPSVRENTKGVSWGDGKANDGMGEGRSIPLSKFYIAKPTDSAKEINKQIEAGKNIYFTPGKYHVDEPILVNKGDTVLLGSGMASIIPTNDEAAMIVSDVDGVKVAGLIFDAGDYSECLLKVGEDDASKDHSTNPTVLQDLFFRIGGTVKKLTKADDALIINSDDVLCDHFWIWRADHGTGVAWDGNKANHGLIVNGDDVTCYALFNEHFEEYDTLWNGERGSTYFYQNEKCYDPFTQADWMSHDGTVNGYAAYKVDDNVKDHYAVGLGIYNVFIYTGGTPGVDGEPGTLGDAKTVSIQMDNAIEVPNAEGVIVENACIQTFANEDGALQKFNHIINGVGDGVSSGHSNGGPIGEGWSRKFLLSYQNGTAVVGNPTKQVPGSAGFIPTIPAANGDPSKNLNDDRGVWLGVTRITNVVDATALKNVYELSKTYNNNDNQYAESAWTNFETERANAKAIIDELYSKEITQEKVDEATAKLLAAIDGLVSVADRAALEELYNANKDKDATKYTSDSFATFKTALDAAKVVLDNDNATQDEVDSARTALETAIAGLVEKADKAALQGLYDANKDKDATKYTAESYAAFETALDDAKAVLANDNATQDEVNDAKTALETAIAGLVEKADKTELADLYDKYCSTDATKYTAESFEVLRNALANALGVLADETATQKQVDAAKAELQKAVDGLKLVGSTGGSTGDGTGDNQGGNTGNQGTGDQGTSGTKPTKPTKPSQTHDTKKGVKTGDDSLVAVFASLALLSAGTYTVLRRRED